MPEEVELDFDVLFVLSKFTLLFNRAHPYIPRDYRWGLQFITMQGLFTICYGLIIYNIVLFDILNNDFVKTCSDGIFGVVYNVVTFQYSVMLWYQNNLNKLIDLVKTDYEKAKTLPAAHREVVVKYAIRGRWVSKLWLATASITGFLFPIKAIVIMIYLAAKGEFKFIPIYDLHIPGPMEEYKNEWGGFLIMYALMLFFTLYAISMYIGFAPLGPIFMLHACGQLELIKIRVENLFTEEEYDSVKINRTLNEIIEQYAKIICFIDIIKETLRFFYEMCLKTTALVIPITFFEVIESFKNGEVSIDFICFIVAGSILCFVPCYYSDLLMDKGQEVSLAVYMSGWEYHWEPDSRKTLLIFLSWAKSPLAIRTVFRIVCLDAFTELCHQSYAIFNVLNAAWS